MPKKDYKWKDYRDSPEEEGHILGILQGCETGTLRLEMLWWDNEEGFKVDKYSKLSNAWSVLAWRNVIPLKCPSCKGEVYAEDGIETIYRCYKCNFIGNAKDFEK